MNAFPIGTSAIATGQRALDLIGQNLANATTPGYHRQAVDLINRVSGETQGVGVDVASITRFTADPVRTAILGGNSQQNAIDTRLSIRQQIEDTLGSGTGGIGDQLSNFFNQIEQLTARPDDTAARRPLVSAASDLAKQFNTTAGDIDRLRNDLGGQIANAVNQVNGYATRIADLNNRIAIQVNQGLQPNDLLDQRDQLVDQLSQQVDIKIVNQPGGAVNVISSGGAIVVGQFANTFQVGPDPSGNLVVTQSGSTQPVTFRSGSLGGKLQEYNTDIPATRARLDDLAGQLISRVNQVQATGLGLTGPITSSTGTVSASSATVPLNAANLPFPVTAGNLTVSVTDTTTGNRTNTTIAIDPATQSLQDIATALSAVPGLSASVNAPVNRLDLQAQPGFAFDFAGRDTNPPGGGSVANPDSSGLLAALGVNGLFAGTDATSIAVRPEIVADPNRLAASVSGQPGDSTNLERFAAIRDQAVIGGRTLAGEYADQASAVGTDVQTLSDQQIAQTNVMQTLSGQEQSVTGVDMNEELVHLLDFQRMISGASKYLSVVNSSLDEIMNIIR
jgi:flagellar hook-associated protein FlgK